ncbi:MAG: DUF5615 family PIN-like protein [Chloroflexota bacterium]
MRFLLDENVPQALTEGLRRAGHNARHVIQIGLRSQPDEVIFATAKENGEIIITGDLDFADERVWPTDHKGIIILRVWPNLTPELMVPDIVAHLARLSPSDIEGNIVVLEPGHVRIRRKPE